MKTENNMEMETKIEIRDGKRRRKMIQISYKTKIRILTIMVVALTILSAITVSDAISVRNIESRQRQTVIREREYLTKEYNDLKNAMSEKIVLITSMIQDNTDLIFTRRDKDKILEAYGDLLNILSDENIVNSITEMDEYNLNMYMTITLIKQDLRGFSTNFAVAFDDRNFNALDNSLGYLKEMIKRMDETDAKMIN